ncbi:hypothetical protein DGG96_03685 [Legionella qingyii]|uniref:Uncharacterized protein n=1 Tax=Legionella qingyii TaxID=2184757 RepID=A0A317U9M6_9GAMM|nr:hypothetical protein DGG96_03685 [Legionella qingyii]
MTQVMNLIIFKVERDTVTNFILAEVIMTQLVHVNKDHNLGYGDGTIITVDSHPFKIYHKETKD